MTGNLGQLERDIATMADNLGSNLDRSFLKTPYVAEALAFPDGTGYRLLKFKGRDSHG